MEPAQHSSPLSRTVFVLYSLTAFIIIASFLFVHLMGYGFLFFTSEGVAFSAQSFSFPVMIIFMVGFFTPGLSAGSVFSFLWIFYAFCFVVAWRWRESFHNVVSRRALGERYSIFRNFLFAMPLLSSMVLTAALAIIYSQSAVGIETGKVQLPPNAHEAFLDVAYAPLREEVAFRIIPIGVLVVLYVFLAARNLKALSTFGSRLKLFFYAFIYPEEAKRMAGLPNVTQNGTWRGISLLEWVLVIATSVIFSLAHVVSPIGWDVGKVTSAFVQGFFLAVTYIVYGFEAPILLHWYFNYYFYFFDPNIAETFFPGSIYLLSTVELLILALGIVAWGAFALEGVRRLFLRQRQPREQPPVQPQPSTSAQQSF